MSIVLQNPVPRTRRRKPVDDNLRIDDDKNDNSNKSRSDDKILEDLRQSIEKTDNLKTMENNLYDPEIKDKMAPKRSHRRRLKKGEDNPSFEPENDVQNVAESKKTDPKLEQEEPRQRRRRRPKLDEKETKNEELSRPEPLEEAKEAENGAEGDGKPSRRRRLRKKDHNDNLEMQNNDIVERALPLDPLMIEDDGQVLSVTIHRTDRLKTDINAIHPMIRVHVMDITTGKFMVKQNKDRKVTSVNEDTEKVTTILPMMTQPFDFKFRRLTIPAWEEPLIFNENANYLTKNINAVLLFEVVDLNTAYSANKSYPVQQQGSGFHHIAWGFLLPVAGNGSFNTDKKLRLQLYENGPLHGINDPHSTNVFYWWKSGIRKAYPSTLYVTVSGITLSPQSSSQPTSRSMFPNQMEGSVTDLGTADASGFGARNLQTYSSLHQWKRLPGQMCHIPNTPQYKLITSPGGTSVLAFSPDGDWLACGALEDVDHFPVLVYNMATGAQQPYITLSGHNRIVHCVAWCPKSELLASASADGTVRLFTIRSRKPLKIVNGDTSKLASTDTKDVSAVNGSKEDEVRVPEKRVLCHPCFVYCVVFHPRSSGILVTAGYDKVIRVWDVAGNRKDILQQLDVHKGYINSVVFSSDGQSMYSGDSVGVIHMWKTPILELNKNSPYKEKWTREDSIEERDVKDVVINHLMLIPNGKRILVHARDGNIRLMDLKIKAMVLKFHGIINTEKNLHSCLSPCGSFLFSGTEDNSEGSQAFVWNALTGDHMAIYRDLNLPGPVNSVDYHPKCHMVAFSAIGSESSILVYTYSPEKARQETGYQTGDSSPNSPRHAPHHPQINYDNLTKLEDSKSKRFAGEETGFSSFQTDYNKTKTDRLSRIINSLNSVTEANQSLRRANRSLDRDVALGRTLSTDGYGSGPEDRGRLVRSSKKSSGPDSIPMTLNATSTGKANFTFKPPPAARHKEQSSKYLGEVVAVYDYDGQRSDELSFVRGELIKIVFRDGKNWLLGEASDGSQGYLPSNYVTGADCLQDVVTDTVEDTKTSPQRQLQRKARFKNSDEVVDFQSTEPPMNASIRSSRRQRRRSSQRSAEDL